MSHGEIGHGSAGFSLIELAIVVVIVSIIGAIATTRYQSAAARASESATRSDIATLERAIEHYAQEHGGAYPTPGSIKAQLTEYSDFEGQTSLNKTSRFRFGPYMRKVPQLQLGTEKGSRTIATAAGAGVGWIYDAAAGRIDPNLEGVSNGEITDMVNRGILPKRLMP